MGLGPAASDARKLSGSFRTGDASAGIICRRAHEVRAGSVRFKPASGTRDRSADAPAILGHAQRPRGHDSHRPHRPRLRFCGHLLEICLRFAEDSAMRPARPPKKSPIPPQGRCRGWIQGLPGKTAIVSRYAPRFPDRRRKTSEPRRPIFAPGRGFLATPWEILSAPTLLRSSRPHLRQCRLKGPKVAASGTKVKRGLKGISA
jgi:hypothetical protein